ncbi:MAG TPA: hypothetical protein GXX23_08670 [Firmicutes bacterium]|nr:hypothetical protein [Candidatus Fermentithermobacillaceae bacterium]
MDKCRSNSISQDEAHVTLAQYLKFYVPLAATGVMLMMNHTTASSAVARAADPAIGLSAYASAFAVGNLFEIMCFGMQRMGLTFIRGTKSMKVVFATAFKILAVITGTMAILSWTPLADFLTGRILGLTPEVAEKTIYSLRLMILWPAVSAIRSLFQSRVVVGKKTGWVTVAMAFRLGASLTAAVFLPKIWPYGPVGAVILVGGLAAEMLVSGIAAWRFVPPLPEEGPEQTIPTGMDILRFFVPLALAQMATPLVRSVMIGSLARTVNSELTLSGYQMATSLSGILSAVTIHMYQPVMVMVRDRRTFREIRKYSWIVGGVACVAILLCSLPGIGTLVLGGIMGAPPDIAASAMTALGVLAISPMLNATNEFNSGILMLKKRTVWVTACKITNATVCALSIVVLTRLFPSGGAMLAALASMLGGTGEAVLSYATVKRLPECREYLEERHAAAAG